jgi:hypothetical protein
MSFIAGAVDVDTVLARLSSVRRVFHSEADFQHAFAWVLHEVDPSLNIRLEVRQDKREYVDLFCFGPKGRSRNLTIASCLLKAHCPKCVPHYFQYRPFG